MISLRNIVKEYKDQKVTVRAVDGIHLEINKGEFVALLGPSGCGKTTTLMMLAGLLKPTSGEIYFGDRLVNHLEPKDRNIGMVFQSYALYPHMTVRDNIAFPLRERKMPKQQAFARALEMGKIVQIDHLMDRKPSQLSGGQRQRVAMARALAKDPDILLLDEPMSNLDARLKLDVRDEIRKLQREIGVTTIIVTHDQEEALAISDRIAILDGGSIQQYGTPNELFAKPRNLFVASFLGNPPMNIFPGQLVRKDGRQVVAMDGLDFVIPESRELEERHIGKEIRLGIRPHHVGLSDQAGDNSMEMLVDLVEHLGSSKLLKLKRRGASSAGSEMRMRILTGVEHLVEEGDIIHLTFREDHFHLFDMTDKGLNISLPTL